MSEFLENIANFNNPTLYCNYYVTYDYSNWVLRMKSKKEWKLHK